MPANVLPFGIDGRAFERRRDQRLRTPHIRAQPPGTAIHVLDMSRHGMSIQTPHAFAVGGIYLFELADEDRSLLVEGRVRWCRQAASSAPSARAQEAWFHSGVAFIGLQPRRSDVGLEKLTSLPVLQSERHAGRIEHLAERVAQLQQSRSANEAAETLIDLLALDFEHVLLLRVEQNSVKAWMGRGPGLVPERLRKLHLGLDAASILLHFRAGGSLYFGKLPPMFPHLQLLRCHQGSLQRQCALLPVRIGSRFVAVLYVDTGEQAPTADQLASLQSATALFSQALLDQILRRRARRAERRA